MKKVVWAYADWTGEGKHDLALSNQQLYVAIASPISWMKYAPSFRRVIYVDNSIYSFLQDKNLLQLWDEVLLVNFKREIDMRYGTHFFAFPKIWAYTQQEDPFFICDTDVVLTRPLSEWFDDTKYWGELYDFSTKIDMSRFNKVVDFINFSKIVQQTPGLRSFCDYTHNVNGGLIYFPDPKKAQILGRTILSLGSEIGKVNEVPENWIYFEESLIVNILKTMGIEMTPYPNEDRGWLEECSMTDQEDMRNLVETVLGLNIQNIVSPLIKV